MTELSHGTLGDVEAARAHGADPAHTGRAHEEEFRALFQASYQDLVRTLWFVVFDGGVAQEIAQDAFVELYRRWGTVADYERPDLWVRRVALRKARREVARTARRRWLERAIAVPDPQYEPDLPDPALANAIRSLPAQQRAAVVLYYLEDRPMEQVADILGCSAATGFVHLHRARHRLAELLAEEVDDVR